MVDFATDVGAFVTPMTAAQLSAGLACGALQLGQLNYLFQLALDGQTPAEVATALAFIDCNGDPIGVGRVMRACDDFLIAPYVHAAAVAVGVATTINPNIGDQNCTPASATFSALVNCTVVLNADGTHVVTVTAAACITGVWSYTATYDCGTKAVSGTVSSSPVTTLLNTTSPALSAHALIVTLGSGGTYSVDWGDGVQSLMVASGVAANHTYAAAYTGPVTITSSTCSPITGLALNTGNWSFILTALPTTLRTFDVFSANTISGDIGTLPAGLTLFNLRGTNTTTGSVGSLPAGLVTYVNTGANTTSGNISGIPATVRDYRNYGTNTTMGDVSTLKPGLLIFENFGSNTISGSVTMLPASLTRFVVTGSNTLSGAINALPPGLRNFEVIGNNTISGNISTLPSTLLTYQTDGMNTTTGVLSSLPAGLTNYVNRGNNTTSGNPNAVPVTLRVYDNRGLNTVVATTTTWAGDKTNVGGVLEYNTPGLTAAQVDNFLVALTSVTSWSGGATVDMRGLNAAPTATGLAAKATILANGAGAVLHN